MSEEKKVTVCSACKCASCWQGLFMCERSVEHGRGPGTIRLTVAELQELDLEHPRFWSDEEQVA